MLEMWHFYVTPTVAYVPTVAKTEAGFFLDVEPIEAVSIADRQQIQAALKRAILSGNPTVPTPDRETLSKSAVLRYANARTWASFEKRASCWEITKRADQYVVQRMKRRSDRGWEDDPSNAEALPLDIAIDELVARMTARALPLRSDPARHQRA